MSLKYSHLLSPVKINNVVLRNRLIATASNPHFIQATEKWPTEALISHYANKAKAGAAVVTCKGNNPVKTNDPHSLTLDIHQGQHQHMFAQVADMVHYYGAKASYLVLPDMNIVKGYDASDGVLSEFVAGDGSKAEYGKAAPKELLYQMVEAYAQEAKLASLWALTCASCTWPTGSCSLAVFSPPCPINAPMSSAAPSRTGPGSP